MGNLNAYPLRPLQRLTLLWEKNQSSMIRVAIVLGVLLASALLGRKASLLYLMLPLGIGVILLFMQRPALGLLLSLLGGFAVPFNGPSGLNITMLGVALLLVLWIMDMLVKQQAIQFYSGSTTRPALWLILISILALGIGQLAWYHTAPAPLGAQLGGLFIIILSVSAFLLVGHQVATLRWLQWFTWIFLAYSALYVVGWSLPAITKYTNHLFQLGSTGSLFWLWVVSLAFSQAAFNRNLHLGWRLCLGGYALFTIFTGAYYLYDWKSGWVPPMVSIGAMMGLLSPQLGIVMAFLSTFPAPRLLNDVIGSDEYSYGTRLDAWRIVLQITKVDPILGLGPANYHWYTPLFPIRGYAVKFNSHSQYIDLIAQTGLLGLGCFLWFMWAVGRLCWRLRTQAPSGFAQAYVYGAFGGLVGTLVAGTLGDWVLPFFYNVGMNGFRSSVLTWVFLGGLVVIERLAAQQGTTS